jgi:peptidoglycan hydrolase CwlO-like protein
MSACADVVFQLETKLPNLHHHADHIASPQQDLKFANDSVTRLQQDIQQQDSELEGLAHRIVTREDEAEDAKYAALKQEHACVADER